MRTLLSIIGVTAVVLALLGVFLPLLPTTPFLLLASACFVRSSPRLHRKLMESPLFGRYLAAYQEGRGIPLKVKLTALSVLWVSIAFAIHRVDVAWLQVALMLIAAAVSIHLYRLKTMNPD